MFYLFFVYGVMGGIFVGFGFFMGGGDVGGGWIVVLGGYWVE